MRYPKEIKTFIADNVKGLTTKELAQLVNETFGTECTEKQMKSYKCNHKLKGEMPKGSQKGRATKTFPQEIQDFIRANYIGTSHIKMSEVLKDRFGINYTKMQIKGFYGNHKLNSGLDGRYTKGNVPFNKGKKKYWVGGEETQFKKGHVPLNYLPVGTERINTYGYMDIKVKDPRTWRGKHLVLWEKANGPVPKDHVVIFADRDNRNFSPENLMLISRRQLLIANQNGLIKEDTDLTKTGILITNLLITAADRKKRL